MPKLRLVLTAAVLFAAIMGLMTLALQTQAEEKSVNDETVYELRTYVCHPGRLPALHARFRDHTMKLFEKHGMQNVLYWTPTDGDAASTTLIYVLSHKSRDAAKKSWDAFRADPDWLAVKAESEKDGPIVAKVESVYMTRTDYSPAG